MATQGPAPHSEAARSSAIEGWQAATVVPMLPTSEPAHEPAVDKRGPARGILLGLAVAGGLWAVALYVLLRAVH